MQDKEGLRCRVKNSWSKAKSPQTQDKEVPSDAGKKNLQKQGEEKPADAG